jgi:hypothetical protein
MPVLLAICHSLGLAYPTAGLLFNLAAHTATLYLAPMLLWRLFGSVGIAAACQLMLLASPELLHSAGTLQTEPLFFALVLSGLYALVLYLERPTLKRLVLMTIAAVLACLQRYTGVALVISVAIVMLAYPRAQPARTRILRTAAYSALGIFPLALWMLRNRSVNRTWGVIPAPAQLGFSDNLRATGRALARYLTLAAGIEDDPLRTFDVLTGVAALGLAVLVVAALVRARSESERESLAVYLAFPPVYLAVLLGFTSYVALDPIGNRYVIPLYPFLWGTLLLGFRELSRRLASAPRALRRAVQTAVVALFAAHVLLAAERTRVFVEQAREEGIGGFTTRYWQRQPIVEWMRANPLEGEIYSNLPELVICVTGHRATFVTPESLERSLSDAPAGAHVVWMERAPRPMPFPALSETARPLARVAHVDGAIVYEVGP